MAIAEAPQATEPAAGGASTAQGIEIRSIEWVPHEERHGKAWHLGAVWFSGCAELTTMATGVVAISLGGNLLWTLIALLIGTMFGTLFVAFHSAQGPQLGLPQMIQSRAQFGYLGVSLLVLPAAFVMYAGYNVFNDLGGSRRLRSWALSRSRVPFGEELERSRAAVEHDISEGFVTREAARTLYGWERAVRGATARICCRAATPLTTARG